MTAGPNEGPDAVRTAPGSLLVPCPVLVGRASETEILAAALGDAVAGHGSAVFVLGEAGIGKSRLVQEVWTIAATRGVPVLRGRAVPGSAGTAYRPLSEALAPLVAEAASAGDLTPWFPALSAMPGQFVLKDLVLLGAALWTAGEALAARRPRALAPIG